MIFKWKQPFEYINRYNHPEVFLEVAVLIPMLKNLRKSYFVMFAFRRYGNHHLPILLNALHYDCFCGNLADFPASNSF